MANGKAELTTEQLLRVLEGSHHGRACHCQECDGIGCPRTMDEACDCGQREAELTLRIAIAETERTDTLNGWTPCSEKLPERCDYYLVARGSNILGAFRWTPDYAGSLNWRRESGAPVTGITHWRELPPLPEGL